MAYFFVLKLFFQSLFFISDKDLFFSSGLYDPEREMVLCIKGHFKIQKCMCNEESRHTQKMRWSVTTIINE